MKYNYCLEWGSKKCENSMILLNHMFSESILSTSPDVVILDSVSYVQVTIRWTRLRVKNKSQKSKTLFDENHVNYYFSMSKGNMTSLKNFDLGPVQFSSNYKGDYRPNAVDPGYFYGDYKGNSGQALFRWDNRQSKNLTSHFSNFYFRMTDYDMKNFYPGLKF